MERTKPQFASLDLAIDMFQDHLHQYLENVPTNALEGDVFEKAAERLISATTPLSSKDTLRQRWEVAIRAEVLSLTVIPSTLRLIQPFDGAVGGRTGSSKGRFRCFLRTYVQYPRLDHVSG
jgi:hypothetical protein